MHLLNNASFKSPESILLPLPGTLRGRYQAGDDINISINDSRLIFLALLQYFLPMAAAVIVTLFAESVAVATDASEIWVILAAIVSLAIGLLSVNYISSSSLNAEELIRTQLQQ